MGSNGRFTRAAMRSLFDFHLACLTASAHLASRTDRFPSALSWRARPRWRRCADGWASERLPHFPLEFFNHRLWSALQSLDAEPTVVFVSAKGRGAFVVRGRFGAKRIFVRHQLGHVYESDHHREIACLRQKELTARICVDRSRLEAGQRHSCGWVASKSERTTPFYRLELAGRPRCSCPGAAGVVPSRPTSARARDESNEAVKVLPYLRRAVKRQPRPAVLLMSDQRPRIFPVTVHDGVGGHVCEGLDCECGIETGTHGRER